MKDQVKRLGAVFGVDVSGEQDDDDVGLYNQNKNSCIFCCSLSTRIKT